MRAYIVRRVIGVLPVLFLASVVLWGVVYAVPGSPANVIAGEFATADQIAAVEARLGLDRPVPVQYVAWLGNAVTGDLGDSALSGQPVTSLVDDSIAASAQLGILGLIVGLIIALPAGIVVALKPRSPFAKLAFGYEALGLAMPTFWLGILLILLFSRTLSWLPSLSSYVPIWSDPVEALRYLALPVLTLGLHVGAVTSRFVAAALRDTLPLDYVRTARSKGISERQVIRRHALPNALIPMVTVVGLQLGGFISGTVVVEVIFNYPGLGRLIANAITARDYALIQGSILFVVLIFIVVNLIVDLLYAWLDPRVRLT